MRSSFHQPLALPLLCGALFFSLSACAQDGKQTLTDDEIRQRLVQASIAAYAGACPCPQSLNRNGDKCGKKSAYSKGGGDRPLCYPRNVSDAAVKRYREQLAKQ
jgi:hypothetical protein